MFGTGTGERSYSKATLRFTIPILILVDYISGHIVLDTVWSIELEATQFDLFIPCAKSMPVETAFSATVAKYELCVGSKGPC